MYSSSPNQSGITQVDPPHPFFHYDGGASAVGIFEQIIRYRAHFEVDISRKMHNMGEANLRFHYFVGEFFVS